MKLKKIIIALDSDNLKKTIKIVNELKDYAFAFKIGYEFFYNFGLEGYKCIKNENVKIFLDLKLHGLHFATSNSNNWGRSVIQNCTSDTP